MDRLIRNSGIRRLRLAGVAAIALACLAGCGQIGGNSANSTFNQSFNASFDKSTHDSCVTSATGGGAPAATAETYCSCFVAQFDKLTVQQKMALNANSPEVTQAATTCKAQLTAAPAPTMNTAQP
jgi:hypothetical protein